MCSSLLCHKNIFLPGTWTREWSVSLSESERAIIQVQGGVLIIHVYEISIIGPLPNLENKALSPTECSTSGGRWNMKTMKACPVFCSNIHQSTHLGGNILIAFKSTYIYIFCNLCVNFDEKGTIWCKITAWQLSVVNNNKITPILRKDYKVTILHYVDFFSNFTQRFQNLHIFKFYSKFPS